MYDDEYFDALTADQIHEIQRNGEDSLSISKSIAEYFIKSDRFDLEQELKELLVEEGLDNPYAVKRMTECYKEGLGVEPSDERYVSNLERYAVMMSDNGNVIRLAKDLYDESYGGTAFMHMTVEDWVRHGELGWACLEIGKYYGSGPKETELRKAKENLQIACWCHFSEAEELLAMVEDKLGHVHDEARVPELAVKAENADSAELYDAARKTLKGFFQDEWEKLQKETRTYLETALYAYVRFMSDDQAVCDALDGSCIIGLLMRALEYEVGKFFFIGYSEYLLKHYPEARDYLQRNGMSEKKWRHRSCLVGMDAKGLTYQYPAVKTFTLGRFNGYVGWKDNKDKVLEAKMDATFLEYCAENTTMKDELELKGWIRMLANGIDRARPVRNRAAHGGFVSSMEEVREVFNLLLWVNKLLLELSKGQK